MKVYDFRLVLAEAPEEWTDAWLDKIYEAGCDDGSVAARGDVTWIDFHREANSLEEAIRSALANVATAGCKVEKLEIAAHELAAV